MKARLNFISIQARFCYAYQPIFVGYKLFHASAIVRCFGIIRLGISSIVGKNFALAGLGLAAHIGGDKSVVSRIMLSS